MKYKGQLRGKFFKAIGFNGCLLIVFLLIVGISVAIQYIHEDTVVATIQSIITQQNVIVGRKQRKMCRKCGQCGYYMAYVKTDGTKDNYGDCASIGMNNECNEGNNHFKDPDELLLQVDEKEDACGFFKKRQTKRVKDYIKAHPNDYYRKKNFKPLKVR